MIALPSLALSFVFARECLSLNTAPFADDVGAARPELSHLGSIMAAGLHKDETMSRRNLAQTAITPHLLRFGQHRAIAVAV